MFSFIRCSAFTKHLQDIRYNARGDPDKGERVFTTEELTVQWGGQLTSGQRIMWKFYMKTFEVARQSLRSAWRSSEALQRRGHLIWALKDG